MMDFFHKSEGVWFSQRTVHRFDSAGDESGDSNLIIKVLDRDDSRVLDICQEQGVDPILASGGASFQWQGNLSEKQPDPNYEAILVDIPHPQNPRAGKFLRNKGYVEGIPVIGVYHFADPGISKPATRWFWLVGAYSSKGIAMSSCFANLKFIEKIMNCQLGIMKGFSPIHNS
jgi:hypothetical protein